MNCNSRIAIYLQIAGMVSIPNRDFDELQYSLGMLYNYQCHVSIPNRDFDELQFAGRD